MREILFRGKQKADGEWVEGDLIHSLGRTYCGTYAETLGEILPETEGQYTGLTDRNGKKIFEGDIIKHYNEAAHPERFEIGMVWWDDCHMCFKRTSKPASVYVWRNCIYEVIGNIHDNPELLD